jgi:hypothetical protein
MGHDLFENSCVPSQWPIVDERLVQFKIGLRVDSLRIFQ